MSQKKIRPIAIYLPQFHPIPENDEWWGRGFTEWTNVVKAKPLFKGHYQPHLPSDLGFYDLRLAEARQAQADLAKEYGIYGFCYYHYWFNGRRLLERPAENMLKTGAPDFPFMLCWANENWTRRWDGSDQIVLLRQEYSEKDAVNHCNALLEYFKDRRYIRVDDRPVFAIYKTQLIPHFDCYIRAFKDEALRNNIDLYIVRFENEQKVEDDIYKYVDASVEFQPHSEILHKYWDMKYSKIQNDGILNWLVTRIRNGFSSLEKIEERYHNYFYHIEYAEYVKFLLKNYSYPTSYKRFPGVTPMWDNTARRGEKSFVFKNSTPELFETWLKFHTEHFKSFSKEENFIFLNAWNEWAEGNHLEPCQKWGRAYLESTKRAFEVIQ